MLDNPGEEKYLFSQPSENSLDQGKALAYIGQARLCSSITLIKGDVLIGFL